MRYDEPDVREAYRSGAVDLFETIAAVLSARQARDIKEWLQELETWQDFDPPAPPDIAR